MDMKEFVIFVVCLAVILVVTSLLLDQLMAVLIVGIITCLTLTFMEKNGRKKNDKL